MLISFDTVPSNLQLSNGYGLAGYNMVFSLSELGHEVLFRERDAEVEIAFCQPEWAMWSNPDAYHIQYTPWESTVLPDGWLDYFNQADELWTPSPVIAEWYRDAGVTSEVKVYEHGIDHRWSPGEPKSKIDGKFVFLHHGSPAPRKGAQDAVNAFLELYDGDPNMLLVLKSHGVTEARILDKAGNIVGDIYNHPNIKVIERVMELDELIDLYRSVDCMIYPGYGEGFGFIPLQALATGLPVICTEAWAPYRRFLDPRLSLGSTLVESPWPQLHQGKMFQPSYDDLKASMGTAVRDIDSLKADAMAKVDLVHKEYDWKTLTEEAFAPIVEKFTK